MNLLKFQCFGRNLFVITEIKEFDTVYLYGLMLCSKTETVVFCQNYEISVHGMVPRLPLLLTIHGMEVCFLLLVIPVL